MYDAGPWSGVSFSAAGFSAAGARLTPLERDQARPTTGGTSDAGMASGKTYRSAWWPCRRRLVIAAQCAGNGLIFTEFRALPEFLGNENYTKVEWGALKAWSILNFAVIMAFHD
ncbi:hypothetical protein [Halotalea alkalilenta]|uniref:hypothetical protein n=1 Tax=Halotalea alkalilenta TaxID=376489 RepID=UPI0012DFAD64|nr:hypothetical protein [Halotalea alkalilenta]